MCGKVFVVMDNSVDMRDLQLLARIIGLRCGEAFLEGPELACENWEKDCLPMWLVDVEVWASAVLRARPKWCSIVQCFAAHSGDR